MSLTIKAYLEKENCECEIRRFLIDQGVSSSFTYLTTKIPQVFPSLAGKNYDLFWKDSSQNSLKPFGKSRKRKAENSIEDQLEKVKISKTNSTSESREYSQPTRQDEENDNIAFSSDEELTEALGFVNDGLFRIYIRTKTGCESNSEDLKHPGVVCDGCEGEIIGTRFKCCVCPDFDLCCKCETSGRHNEHCMFRIRTPGPFFRQGFMGGPPPHPFGPPPPYGGGQGQWRGMKRCWRKWMKKMYEQSQQGKDGEGFECGKEAKEPRKERPQKESAEKQGQASANCEEEDSPTEEYLKDVGESVADMLGPLGIDVNIDVECEGKRKKCMAGGRRGGWGGWGRGRGMGWGRGGFWGMGGMGPGMGGMGPGMMGRMGGPCWPGSENWGGNQQQQQRCGPDTGRMAGGGCCPKTTEATCSGAPQSGDEDVPMGSPMRSEQSDGDWMVLTEDRDQGNLPSTSCGSAPETVAEAANQAPPLHPIPKMAHALEQLMAMGFGNDGGWLTQLVESKDGDLNKILDAVKPHTVKTAAEAPAQSPGPQ